MIWPPTRMTAVNTGASARMAAVRADCSLFDFATWTLLLMSFPETSVSRWQNKFAAGLLKLACSADRRATLDEDEHYVYAIALS